MAAEKVTKLNTKYGYVILHKPALLALPKPVLSRVVGALLRYVSADTRPVGYKQLESLTSMLPRLEKTVSVHGCSVFPLHSEDLLGMAARSKVSQIKPHPITVGESLHWNNKWVIKLSPEPGPAMVCSSGSSKLTPHA